MAIAVQTDAHDAHARVERMVEGLDRGDVDTYMEPFAMDACFRFGNQPPVSGRDNIRNAVADALQALHIQRHNIIAVWSRPDVIIAEFAIEFKTRNADRVTLPCVSVIRLRDDVVIDYRITMDAAPALS